MLFNRRVYALLLFFFGFFARIKMIASLSGLWTMDFIFHHRLQSIRFCVDKLFFIRRKKDKKIRLKPILFLIPNWNRIRSMIFTDFVQSNGWHIRFFKSTRQSYERERKASDKELNVGSKSNENDREKYIYLHLILRQWELMYDYTWNDAKDTEHLFFHSLSFGAHRHEVKFTIFRLIRRTISLQWWFALTFFFSSWKCLRSHWNV